LQRSGEDRRQSRSNVFLSATLASDGRSVPVRVRNLSARGALLEGPGLVRAGTRVRLMRGSLAADGEIAWDADRQAGIRFNGTIDVAAWIKRVEHSGQQSVDAVVATLRSEAPASAGFDPQKPSLARIVLELDSICERLAGSPSMSVEVGEELVRLEALARTLEQIVSAT